MAELDKQINLNAFSLVFHIRSLNSNTVLPPFTGHLVRGFVLRLIKEVNPDISDILHQGNNIRPYSVSTIYNPNGHLPRMSQGALNLNPSHSVAFRFSTINQDINQALVQGILSLSNTPITLANKSFLLETVSFESNHFSEHNLIPHSFPTSFSVQFLTPTQFSRMMSSQAYLFPDPMILFGNLMNLAQSLNIFNVDVDSEDFIQYISRSVHPINYQLKTRKISTGKVISMVGFTGWARYRITDLNDSNVSFLPILLKLGSFLHVGNKRTAGFGEIRYSDFV